MNLSDLLIAAFEKDAFLHKNYLDFAIHVIESTRLFRNVPVAPNLLSQSASRVYEYAHSNIEITVLQKSLSALFEYYAAAQKNIIPPPILLPVEAPEQFWNETLPGVNLCNTLIAAAYKGTKNVDEDVRLISLLILLARHSGIENLQSIRALISTHSNYIILDSEMCISKADEKLFFLDGICLFLIKKICELRHHATSDKHLKKLFGQWLDHSDCGSDFDFNHALMAVNLMTKPIFSRTLGQLDHELSLPSYIFALTQIHQSLEFDTQLKTRKGRLKKFDIDGLLPSLTETAFEHYGYFCSDFDKEAFNVLNLTLNRFRAESTRERHQGVAFKSASNTLYQLLEMSRTRCSAITFFAIHYCVKIFIHGTPWKDRLRISTVLEYSSRIQNFINNCFCDDNLIAHAQENQGALNDLTDYVADAIIGITSPSIQNTILIFLQFLYTHTAVKFFDETRLEYRGAGAMLVRSHYLAPEIFEQALENVAENSIESIFSHSLWFLRLCYYLGLRNSEAEGLKIIDISDRCIYVSNDELRKSGAGYRRVFLSYITPSLHNSFKAFCKRRIDEGCEFLFEPRFINYYLDSVMKALKAASGIDDLVVHSLRHCAANNQLWMLFIAAFYRSDLITKYSFLNHELFSESALKNIREDFRRAGRELSIITPIFEIVSTSLGHCSPAITAASYWHTLGLLEFEINPMRAFNPDEEFISAIYGNNYKYDFINSNLNNGVIPFKNLIHGFTNCKKVGKKSAKLHCAVNNTRNFTFLTFIDEVLAFIESPDKCAGELKSFLQKNLTRSKNQEIGQYKRTCFLKCAEMANEITVNSNVRNAFKTTQRMIEADRITDVRTLRHFLKVLSLTCPYQFKLPFFHHSDGQLPLLWQEAIHHYRFSELINLEVGEANFLSLKFLKSSSERVIAFKAVVKFFNLYLEFNAGGLSE